MKRRKRRAPSCLVRGQCLDTPLNAPPSAMALTFRLWHVPAYAQFTLNQGTVVTPSQFEPSAQSVDPRRQPGFQSRHWPLCDGKEAPAPETQDLHERRCLEFLAAFYQLNRLQNRLLIAQKSGDSEEAQALLTEISQATMELEALEDRYAPIGFFGEPVLEDFRYCDIHFVRPEVPRIPAALSSVSSHIAIPGLDEIPNEERNGQPRLWRWNHAKVDL